MSAIEKLFDEHRLIERVINALEVFASGTFRDCEQGRCDLMRLVTFFREYADLVHHEKEEEILMPALSQAGVRWDEGIMQQIRKDHEFERYLLQTLRHAALQTADWSSDDCKRVNEISMRFVQFMRSHIAREDHQLLPIVQERLTAAARDELASQLERFDAQRDASGETKLLAELGEDLARRFASATSARANSASST